MWPSVHKNWSRESMKLLTPVFSPMRLMQRWEARGSGVCGKAGERSGAQGTPPLVLNPLHRYSHFILISTGESINAGPKYHKSHSRNPTLGRIMNRQIPSVMGNRAIGNHLLDHGLRAASYVWGSPFRSKVPKWRPHKSFSVTWQLMLLILALRKSQEDYQRFGIILLYTESSGQPALRIETLSATKQITL